ncbi:MAG: anthranilate synthase component I [Chloroflexi bacterium]|nr:anthranilate synthase component I [Chloroflexota bacterium]
MAIQASTSKPVYHPTLDEVRRLGGQGNLVPVYREILADLETPVSAYLKVADGGFSFLLESVEGGERWARYSFIGADPYLIATMRHGQAELKRGQKVEQKPFTDPLAIIRDELSRHRLVVLPELPRFHGGAVGYLGYEVARYFERLPAPASDPLGLPEAVILFTDTLLVFDHFEHKIKVLSHARLDDGVDAAYEAAVGRIDRLVNRLRGGEAAEQPLPNVHTQRERATATNMSQPEFEGKVEQALEAIRAGEAIQVVLSQRLSRPTSASPFTIYRALRTVNPSPYMYYLNLGDFAIVGSSPELLVRVEDGIASTRPLAGTRRRGRTPEEDAALEAELRADEKERAEHIMLVDLGRNDLGRVCQQGSVAVTELMGVERYSHVMHLVSHVTGRLREDQTPYDALRSCFPAGTVSGAPKIRAMELIAELEPDQRGPYAGAVGYFSYSGNLDTAITIRTLVMKDGVAHLQVGAGIVADSIPEREYQETANKARGPLAAIEAAEELEGSA